MRKEADCLIKQAHHRRRRKRRLSTLTPVEYGTVYSRTLVLAGETQGQLNPQQTLKAVFEVSQRSNSWIRSWDSQAPHEE